MWVGATVPIGEPIGAGITTGVIPGILTLIGAIHIIILTGDGILIGPTVGAITTTTTITRITIGMAIMTDIILVDMAVV